MDSNWEHQKKAVTTDQKFRTDDDHIHELDKKHFKENEKDMSLIPGPPKKSDGDEKE